MTALSKGANSAVPTAALRAVLRHGTGPGVPDVDMSALLLTDTGKVRDDTDFVFYNAPVHPGSPVRHVGGSAGEQRVDVDLAGVEAAVERVVLSASADGGTFGQVPGLRLVLQDAAGSELVSYDVTDAGAETAFVLGELYRRQGGWKLRAVGQGWASGLAGLATDFGISVDDAPAAAVTPAAPATPAPSAVSLKKQKQVDLEKRAAREAPQLVDLVKKASVSLQKRGLDDHTARVAVCLDISGSMHGLYRSGKVQALLERVLALALRFDDDGAVDVFTFGLDGHEAGTLDLSTVKGYTQVAAARLEGGTRYAKAMRLVRRHYFGSDAARSTPLAQPVPVYCMFVTDGETSDRGDASDQVRSSSYEPLFWQFMAIDEGAGGGLGAALQGRGGGLFGRRPAAQAPAGVVPTSAFPFLEELDDMGGRYVDNADFFAVSDPVGIPDEQLFDLLMTEYPGWLTAARAKGLLQG
jgi:stress response protein SCP2